MFLDIIKRGNSPSIDQERKTRMDIFFVLIVIATLVFSYKLARKGQKTRSWSKNKTRFQFGVYNAAILFFGLLLIDSWTRPSFGAFPLLILALVYGGITFGLSWVTFHNHRQEKKNLFDEDFVPQRDIWILEKGKELFKMEAIAIIIVVLPLLAIFITLYFIE